MPTRQLVVENSKAKQKISKESPQQCTEDCSEECTEDCSTLQSPKECTELCSEKSALQCSEEKLPRVARNPLADLRYCFKSSSLSTFVIIVIIAVIVNHQCHHQS